MKRKSSIKGKKKSTSRIQKNTEMKRKSSIKGTKKPNRRTKKNTEILLTEIKGNINSQLKQVEYAAFFVIFFLIGAISFLIYKLVNRKSKTSDDTDNDSDNETNSQKPGNDISEKPSDKPDNGNGGLPPPKPPTESESPTFGSELKKIFTGEALENVPNFIWYIIAFLLIIAILLFMRRTYRAYSRWFRQAKIGQRLLFLTGVLGLGSLVAFFVGPPGVSAALFTAFIFSGLLSLIVLLINAAFTKLTLMEDLFEKDEILNKEINNEIDTNQDFLDNEKTDVIIVIEGLKKSLRDQNLFNNNKEEYDKKLESYRALTDALQRKNTKSSLSRFINFFVYFNSPSSEELIEKIKEGDNVESGSWFSTFNKLAGGVNYPEKFKSLDNSFSDILSGIESEAIQVEEALESLPEKAGKKFRELRERRGFTEIDLDETETERIDRENNFKESSERLRSLV